MPRIDSAAMKMTIPTPDGSPSATAGTSEPTSFASEDPSADATPAGTPVRVKIGTGTLPPTVGGRSNGSAAPDSDGFADGAEGSATAGREPVPAVVLDVEDDGPGMPPEQAQRVFERFYRADAARNRASGGTGLGLAIVAGLVSAHGGTVSVRTAPGEGADFQVRLPLSPDALVSDDPDDTLPE